MCERREPSGGELGDELAEHVGVAHRVVVGVDDGDEPLLVEARRQQDAAVMIAYERPLYQVLSLEARP